MADSRGWQTALVTGASSGLGVEFARQLAHTARRLILVARRENRLRELAADLEARHRHLRVEVVPFDLSAPGAGTALAQRVTEAHGAPDFLINNAGLGDIGTFAGAEWEKLRQVIYVNLVALTELTHGLLPAMLKEGRGSILNVSSTAGFIPLPTFAVYAATKAYVNSFSEALAVELKGTGVTVTALCPGPVETEFGEVATRPGGHRKFAPPAALLVRPEQVVAEALEAAQAGRPCVVPGALVKAGAFFMEIVPVPVLRWFLAFSGRVVAKEKAAAP